MLLSADATTFDRRNFLLAYAWPENFGHSQWTISSRRLFHAIFVAYRALVALYWTTITIIELVQMGSKMKYFPIFLTHWGAVILVAYFWYALVISVIDLKRGPKFYARRTAERSQWEARTGLLRQIFWALFTTISTIGIVISVVYWTALYHPIKNPLTRFCNDNMHGVNTALIIIEHFIVASPMRLFHAWIPLVTGFIYVIFTLIYHAVGGTNDKGESFIYPILDYTNAPGKAAGYIAAITAIAPLVHAALYGLYLIKRAIYRLILGCVGDRLADGRTYPLNVDASTYNDLEGDNSMPNSPNPKTTNESKKTYQSTEPNSYWDDEF